MAKKNKEFLSITVLFVLVTSQLRIYFVYVYIYGDIQEWKVHIADFVHIFSRTIHKHIPLKIQHGLF